MATHLLDTDPVCAAGEIHATDGAFEALKKLKQQIRKEKRQAKKAYLDKIKRQAEEEDVLCPHVIR